MISERLKLSHRSYSNVYEKLANLEKNELLTETGCLRPCSYSEYKGSEIQLTISYFTNLPLKLAEEPINFYAVNETELEVMLASSSVTMLKEEEAFPLGSFVADFGGVLGLFVGFNFLIVYDLLVEVIKKVQYILRDK